MVAERLAQLETTADRDRALREIERLQHLRAHSIYGSLVNGLDEAESSLRNAEPEVRDAEKLFAGLQQTLDLGSYVLALDRGTPEPRRSPTLTGFGYGSPWWMQVIAVASPMSLAAILFGLKRYCGLDLEIQIKRARLKKQLLEARRELEDALQDGAASGEEPLPEDLAEILRQAKMIDFFPWAPDSGQVSDDDPPSGLAS